ncbi:hypothetical protein [Rubrivivax gelatinosus]|uniref:hypothetical protein n=1 Tax=Rubrivivax gelatinosus TaxID=28068 RepID=UPI00104AED4D|nr:hypothetical protein [Rubrivivax gelatinosus]MBK1686429.1 hypothetical protein [Rubrivivax gelatinosus]
MNSPTSARRVAALTTLLAASVFALTACDRREPEPTPPTTGTSTPPADASGTGTVTPGATGTMPGSTGSDSTAGAAMDPASEASR